MAFHRAMDWHEGETAVHNLTGVSRIVGDNPTSTFLSPRAAYMASRYPLIALGTTATNATTNAEEIWCTVWGGSAPLAQQVAPSVLGIRAIVDTKYDPVVELLFGGKVDGEVMREDSDSGGRPVAGLSIHLEERGRVKLAGRVMAGACSRHQDAIDSEAATTSTRSDNVSSTGAGEAQLVLKISQSLGNCPKYLNRKTITPAIPNPQLLESGAVLGQQSLSLVSNADLFFVASAHKTEDMDCNHRGGPPGFIRASTTSDQTASTLTWPEYSGNNLYQTLGNLHTTPTCGICIPDFTTGSVLYLTGSTEILIGTAASAVLTHSSLAVRFTVTSSRLVSQGLPFRGQNIPAAQDQLQGRSPYNPRVRYLVSENLDPNSKTTAATAAAAAASKEVTATLTAKTRLTPTITRYRFSLSDPATFGPWKPGQYVAMDFFAELDLGYSHMRDDDPGSLNDDYIRNFTVSSAPGSLGVHGEEFEVTVRNVGRVTGWLAHTMQRVGMVEVGVRGFGGEFVFDFDGRTGGGEKQQREEQQQQEHNKAIGFVAGGIGITPLLGQMGHLLQNHGSLLKRLKVLWSVGIRDVGLVADLLGRYPALVQYGIVHVFLTGDEGLLGQDTTDQKRFQEVLEASTAIAPTPPDHDQAATTTPGLKLSRRRLNKDDLVDADKQVDEWYLCSSPAMREEIQRWLPERAFVWENFNY